MKPTEKAPNLSLPLVNDTEWELYSQNPEHFTLLVFYRGLHCPVCKKQLEDLSSKLEDFKNEGVNVVAISMDTEKRAKLSQEKWDTGNLPIAYGLSKEDAKTWGLYFSKAISDSEPELFSEPGLFLIKNDHSLYFSSIQTMPFARPKVEDLIKAIQFIKDKDYPARGKA